MLYFSMPQPPGGPEMFIEPGLCTDVQDFDRSSEDLRGINEKDALGKKTNRHDTRMYLPRPVAVGLEGFAVVHVERCPARASTLARRGAVAPFEVSRRNDIQRRETQQHGSLSYQDPTRGKPSDVCSKSVPSFSRGRSVSSAPFLIEYTHTHAIFDTYA